MAVRSEQRVVVDEPNCPYARKYTTQALGYFAAKAAKSLTTPSWYIELTQQNVTAISKAVQQATALYFGPWMPTIPLAPRSREEQAIPSTEVVIPEVPTPTGPETEEQRQDRLHTNMLRKTRACIRCLGQLTSNPPSSPIDCPLIVAVADTAGEGRNYFLDDSHRVSPDVR